MRSRLTIPALVSLPVLVIALAAQAQLEELDATDRSWSDITTSVTATICHIPPGSPCNARTMEVEESALPAHLSHGDLLSACPYMCDGVPSPVPQTGQRNSYWSGDDGEYQCGVWVEPRFTDNGDGTVTDNLTGLIWLRWANYCFGSSTNWQNAMESVSFVADGICGLTDGSLPGDWRVPNLKEVLSLIDYGQQYPALPPGHPFDGTPPDQLWSSTSVVSSPSSNVWTASLDHGEVYALSKTGRIWVWPVRGGM